jgi:tRNA nucleotidyltransferase/poly(A) polymerase
LDFNIFIREYLHHSIQGSEQVFLVGGAIRDSFLGLKRKDLDFVCSGNTRDIARRFADRVGGNFYTLDKNREIYRVLATPTEEIPGVYDFAKIRGNTIEEDLQKRDFTINAMAMDPFNSDSLIDPCHGVNDLRMKRLVPVSQECLSDDPVRLIRAVRYSSAYGLSISREFSHKLKASVGTLKTVSIERIRDEVFKILEGENLQLSLHLLDHFKILSQLGFGASDEIQSGIALTLKVDELIRLILSGNMEKVNRSLYTSRLTVQLGRFKSKLADHYLLPQNSGRSRKADLLFTGMILNPSITENSCLFENFGLSSSEIDTSLAIVKSLTRASELIRSEEKIERRSIYKFFKPVAETGVDLVFMTLAGMLAKPVSEISTDQWMKALANSDSLLSAWYEQKELVCPTPFLTGNDLMFHFDLAPGPIIGELIESLKEEQAAGLIKDKKSALAWVDQKLIKFN